MTTPSARTWRRIIPFLIGGTASAVILFFILRAPGEALTRENLTAARALWAKAGAKDYTLTLDIEGGQHGLHEITVIDGRVRSMKTEGADVPASVHEYWTVEGMFRFLEEELLAQREPEGVHGVTDPRQVVLRTQFDSERGYPMRFMRHIMGKGSAIRWHVRTFETPTPRPKGR